MRPGEAIMAGVEKISQHSVQVEIDETGPFAQEEGVVEQHLLKRDELLFQFAKEVFLPCGPIRQATPPKPALFMAQKQELVGSRDKLPPVNVI